MPRKLVAGNWKMHGSRAETAALISGIKQGIAGGLEAEVLVCPPFILLEAAAAALSGSRVALGAQNVSDKPSGAYTGEVSAAMLADAGCQYVLVGHSERRALYGETDDLVAGKFAASLEHNLRPVLCVGESLEEHEAGQSEAVVARQLNAVLDRCGAEGFANAVLAYEPVWAIGTGKTATPEHAQAVHAFARGVMASRDAKIASSLRILYGGSCKPGNAAELFGMADVDGGLIGGAALKAADFVGICAAAG